MLRRVGVFLCFLLLGGSGAVIAASIVVVVVVVMVVVVVVVGREYDGTSILELKCDKEAELSL